MDAATLNIGIDPAQVARALDVLSPAQLQKIERSAIRETLNAVRTDIGRTIRGELNLSAADARAAVSTTLRADTAGEVTVTRIPVPLAHFPVAQKSGGVLVTARKTEPGRVVPGAFIVYKIGGHVFVRGGKGAPRRVLRVSPTRRTKGGLPRKYLSELPISKKYGPTALGVLAGKPGLLDGVLARGADTLAARVASKIDYAAGGGAAFAEAPDAGE